MQQKTIKKGHSSLKLYSLKCKNETLYYDIEKFHDEQKKSSKLILNENQLGN
jgi:hypothetical protein